MQMGNIHTMDSENTIEMKLTISGEQILTFIPAKPDDMTMQEYQMKLMQSACCFMRTMAMRFSNGNKAQERNLLESMCECAMMDNGFTVTTNAQGGRPQ